MAKKINWLLMWKAQKFPVSAKEKLQKAKADYEKKAVKRIETQLKGKTLKLDKATNPKAKIRKYTPLTWRQVNGKPGYYKLYTYLTPPAKPVPKITPSRPNAAGAVAHDPITPPPPPQP